MSWNVPSRVNKVKLAGDLMWAQSLEFGEIAIGG